MAEDKFKFPCSSYEELSKIIKAYGQEKGPASLDDIANATALNRTVISGNNGFLLGAGIVDGGNQKSVTEMGRKLAMAMTHNVEYEVASAWREIATNNTFLQRMVSAIRVRNGMDAPSFKNHMAFSSGLPRTQQVMTGAGTILEILRIGGLVNEAENGLIIAVDGEQSSSQEFGRAPKIDMLTQTVEAVIPTAAPMRMVRQSEGVSLSIKIDLQVSVSYKILTH